MHTGQFLFYIYWGQRFGIAGIFLIVLEKLTNIQPKNINLLWSNGKISYTERHIKQAFYVRAAH